MDGNADELWPSFADILLELSKENIPESRPRPECFDTPWMNKDTLRAVRKKKKKKKLWKIHKYCRNPGSGEKYINARNLAADSVKKAKFSYEKNITLKSKEDSKMFWRFVKSRTKVNDKLKCLVNKKGEIVTQDQDKAELLNSFYCSVFTREETHTIPIFERRNDKRNENIEFLEKDILTLLLKIKETKSPGADKIHPKSV